MQKKIVKGAQKYILLNFFEIFCISNQKDFKNKIGQRLHKE